jgi:hypothetical protein
MHTRAGDSRRPRLLLQRIAHHRQDGRRHGRHIGPAHLGGGPLVGYGDASDGQDYVDRTAVDFDPALGLYSGTAVTGHTRVAEHRAGESPTAPTAAQRAAERDAAETKVGRDPLAVRRYPSPERADIAAGEEIDHDAAL